MLKRTRGVALLLCMICVAGCSSNQEVQGDMTSGDAGEVARYSSTLSALEGEMGQVGTTRAWSGKYFPASAVQGAVVNGDDLFVWVFNGKNRHYEVHCIAASSGTPRWMVDVGTTNLRYPPRAGDRFVVMTLDNGAGMVVVNRWNGARPYRMRTAIEQLPTSSAGSSDSTVYTTSLVDDRVHALSPDTGLSGWAWRASGSIVSGPVVTPNLPRRLVVFGTDEGEVVALPPNGWSETRPTDPAWDRTIHGDVSGPISVAQRMGESRLDVSVLVPCEDRGLYCLDAATGESRWVYRTAHPFRGPARAAGGRVFARNERRLFCVDLATGDAAWKPSAEGGELEPFEELLGVAAADDARAYLLGTGKRVVRCEGNTGEFIRSASLPSYDWVVPAAGVNLLIGLTRDGHIVAFN